MLMKAAKFCKQKCYFLPFFCPANHSMAYKLILHAKGTRAVPGKQKVSVMELVVDSSTNKISVLGKGKYCFHGPERQMKRSSS